MVDSLSFYQTFADLDLSLVVGSTLVISMTSPSYFFEEAHHLIIDLHFSFVRHASNIFLRDQYSSSFIP